MFSNFRSVVDRHDGLFESLSLDSISSLIDAGMASFERARAHLEEYKKQVLKAEAGAVVVASESRKRVVEEVEDEIEEEDEDADDVDGGEGDEDDENRPKEKKRKV